MKKVGIIVNLTKDINLELTVSIVNWLEEHNYEPLLTEIAASQLNKPNLGHPAVELYKEAEFVMVLGGDGTLLGVARQISWLQTPILGINLGHLGFITEVETKDVFCALEKVTSGEYEIEERIMLEATVIKDDIQTETFYCLNDIGITKGILSRIITLKTYINDKYVDTYNADGLLVCTPTGSTAYSLSAGGPIISPWLRVLSITPICPHSLNSRALIVSENEVIKVHVEDNYQDVYLTVDGQQGYKLRSDDCVIIKKASFNSKLIKVSDRSFYDILRSKLKERSI